MIIDANGKFLGATHPSNLTVELLRRVISGESLDMELGESAPSVPSVPDATSPSFDTDEGAHIIFRKTRFPDAEAVSPKFLVPTTNTITWINSKLSDVVPWAFDQQSPHRLRYLDGCDQSRVDLIASVPPNSKYSHRLLRRFVMNSMLSFGVEAIGKESAVQAYVLRSGNASKLTPTVVKGGHKSAAPGELIVLNGSTSALAEVLERRLDRPVINETGIDGRFDFRISWDEGDIQSLRDTLSTEFGLELRSERRQIGVFEIRLIQ